MTRAVVACLAAMAAAAALDIGAQPREDVTARVITFNARVDLPIRRCTVASMTAFITKRLAIPAGIESMPGDCREKPLPTTDVVQLESMTVAEALDRLVEIDPRYYWTESRGVIVVRPVDAWRDAKHFLNQPVGHFQLTDVDIGQALHAVMEALDPKRRRSTSLTMAGTPLISVPPGANSGTEALDAIVRARGEAQWHVEYCLPETRPEYARVFLRTYDDRGIGVPGGHLVDEKGRFYDPCRRSGVASLSF
jgi:hypothetical protein